LLCRLFALLMVFLGAAAAQEEAATLPYTVTIGRSGDAGLDALLRASSGLIALRDAAPTDAEGILSRIAAEAEKLRPAFESEGFWAGAIAITAEVALDAAALAAAPRPLALTITPTPGPRYMLRNVDTTGGPAIPLTPGQPARAEAVLQAQGEALEALRRDGRPLAGITREVTVDHAARAMDVRFTSTPGPRANFANPSVTGTERVDPEVVRRVAALRLAEGSYSPDRLSRARADVSGLGPFASVRMETGQALDADGRLPVTVAVRERAFRAISASAAFETNFGAALRLAWEHRNLFGGAENLRVELEASRLGSDLDRTNARAAVIYRQPLPLGRDGALVTQLTTLRERLDSYDRDAVLLSALYERRLSQRWTLSTGPTAELGQTGPPGGRLAAYQVAGWLVQARYDSSDNLLDPRRGIRASASVTPSYAFNESTAYLPLRLTATTYFDLSGDGRSILALRGALGSLLNASADAVPRAQRFYAGGGGSVRGYDFQSIGPRDARNKPSGGASLLEASMEFRQRFGANYGAVAFVDAGSVGTRAFAPTDELRVGAGLGLRYYTAIGPIRADVAVPLIRQAGSGSFGLYIGIGHAY
jgi:translocation and assembly module TamA